MYVHATAVLSTLQMLLLVSSIDPSSFSSILTVAQYSRSRETANFFLFVYSLEFRVYIIVNYTVWNIYLHI